MTSSISNFFTSLSAIDLSLLSSSVDRIQALEALVSINRGTHGLSTWKRQRTYHTTIKATDARKDILTRLRHCGYITFPFSGIYAAVLEQSDHVSCFLTLMVNSPETLVVEMQGDSGEIEKNQQRLDERFPTLGSAIQIANYH